MHIWGKVPNRSLLKAVSSFLVFSSVQLDIRLGTIQQLHHAVVAPTGEGKNDGSIMHRGGWWSKRWCMMVMVQDLYLMLLFLGLLPQATAWNSQKISFIRFAVCSTNIFYFVLNMRMMMTTTRWSAKRWCNRKALPTSLKCLKNGWRNCWIVPYVLLIVVVIEMENIDCENNNNNKTNMNKLFIRQRLVAYYHKFLLKVETVEQMNSDRFQIPKTWNSTY